MIWKPNSTMYLLISLVISVIIATQVSSFPVKEFLQHYYHHLQFNPTWVIILALLPIIYLQTRRRTIYLVNFSCYKPRDCCKLTTQNFINCSYSLGKFTEESIEFQQKVLEKSGIGEETYLPEAVTHIPPYPSLAEARKEAEELMFGAIDQLFVKATNINLIKDDIGILIVNCSMLSPTPSLSSMVVNHYKLRSNIMSYNLGGMGCSAGIISIELAQKLLQVHNNSYALVVSVECGTLAPYIGNERSMLVGNCLFRMGGSAILLSNKNSDKRQSKYELLHIARTHKGADDKSFTSVTQKEDSQGIVGVCLSKNLMDVAGDALKANMTTLGPLVLPLSEKLLFLANIVMKKVLNMKKLKPYVPDFKLAFEHFCIHVGGKAVLDAVQKNLMLTDWLMEPSRMTLYRFGNTSTTSIWYELAYTEAKGRVKRGDRVWQIAFGSGFKCNSAVWRAVRTVDPALEINPWMDEISSLPVDVPTQ